MKNLNKRYSMYRIILCVLSVLFLGWGIHNLYTNVFLWYIPLIPLLTALLGFIVIEIRFDSKRDKILYSDRFINDLKNRHEK